MSESHRRRRSRLPAPPPPEAGQVRPHRPRPAHHPPPPPPHGYAPPESLAGKGRPPVWVWPSIAVGLIYPALARSARLDAELIERLPDPPTNLRRLPSAYQTLLVAFIVLVAVFFSLFRGGGSLTSWLGLGYDVVFTESYPFMLLALMIGMLSPSAGLLLVMLHIPFDLVASAVSGSPFGSAQLEPLLPALAGRAVSWWLLWLLAVGIPLMARSIPGATLASRQPRDVFMRTLLAYAAGGVVGGILLWMWTAALPFLVRPVFAWTVLGSPTDQAVQPIQASGNVIIIVGVLLALGMTAVRQRFGVLDEEVHEINQPEGDVGQIDTGGDGSASGRVSSAADGGDDAGDEPLFSDQLETIGKIATQAFAVIALGGMIGGAIDVAVLFGAALIGQLAASRLTRWHVLATTLWRVPWVIRFIGAFLLTFLIGIVVNTIIFQPIPEIGSEFFPLVITTALGLALFRVLLGVVDQPEAEPESGESASPAPGIAAGVIAALALGGLALFAVPPPVSANNCSGWGDCPVTMEAVAAAGAGSAAVVAVTAALAAARAEEPRERDKRRRRRRRRRLGGGAQGEPVAPGNVIQRLRERALRNYFGR